MAGKTIKGITVEIGGDTTKLGNALKQVNSSTKSLQTELKGVNTLLKTVPSNVTLLTQKQELLTKAISETKEKLNTLREAQAQVQAQFEKGDITEEQYRDFQREIVTTEQKLKSLENEAKEFGSVFKQQCEAASEKMKEVGGKIGDAGKKLLPVTGTISAIGVASVKTAADFDTSMSQVAATMGMTREEINNGSEDYAKLEKAARDMGAATKYSAGEAADALNYLALAGYDTDTAVSTLPTVLNLAAAGNIELASASDMVTDAMSALGLSTEQAGTFVDKMAKTSQKSNTNVAQLGEAILTVGGTAKNLSGGVTELNACLGILADNGIKGAEGGTKLRNIILSLTAPTDTATAQIKALGLEIYDAEGNMRPLNDVFNDLNGTLSKMTQGEQTNVLNTIFNKADLKGVNALLANSNERFNELSGYINDSEDAAANMADTMQNNLNGQITILKSALSEAAISIGQALMPLMKQLTGVIQTLVDKFNNLSPAAKTIIIIISGIAAAIGPALIIVGQLVSSVGSIIKIFPLLKTAITAVKGAMAGLNTTMLANPIFLIIAAVTALIAIFVVLYNKCDWFREAVDKVWAKLKEGFNAVLDWFKELPEKISAFVERVKLFFTETIPNAVKGFIENIKNFFKENWQTLLLLIVNPFAGAFKLLYDNCEVFRNTINNFVEKIRLFFVEAIPNAIKTAIQWFSELPYKIGQAIGVIIGHIVLFAQNIWNFFTVKLPEYILIAIDWFKSLPGRIWDAIVSAHTNIAIWCVEMGNKARIGISTIITNVTEWFKSLPSKIWNAIILAVHYIANWCTEMKSKAVSGITGLVNSVTTWFKSLPTKISNAISNGIYVISNWCISMKNKAVSGVKNVADSIVSGFKSLPNKMIDIGKNIVEGIWNGIKNAKAWMFGKIKEFANGILDGIKSTLDIHSPSRVFRDQVGKFIAEGIGVGITENEKAPTEALKHIANSMLNETQSINGITLNRQIENTFGGNVASNGAILEYLSDIVNKLDRKMQIVLDSGAIVGETTDLFNNALGTKKMQTSRGW